MAKVNKFWAQPMIQNKSKEWKKPFSTNECTLFQAAVASRKV